jgi:hypothetical protein
VIELVLVEACLIQVVEALKVGGVNASLVKHVTSTPPFPFSLFPLFLSYFTFSLLDFDNSFPYLTF